MAGASFDHPGWPNVPQHAVVDDRVEIRERRVVERVPQSWLPAFVERLFLVEPLEVLQEFELRSFLQIDTRDTSRRRREHTVRAPPDVVQRRDRRVEVPG